VLVTKSRGGGHTPTAAAGAYGAACRRRARRRNNKDSAEIVSMLRRQAGLLIERRSASPAYVHRCAAKRRQRAIDAMIFRSALFAAPAHFSHYYLPVMSAFILILRLFLILPFVALCAVPVFRPARQPYTSPRTDVFMRARASCCAIPLRRCPFIQLCHALRYARALTLAVLRCRYVCRRVHA